MDFECRRGEGCGKLKTDYIDLLLIHQAYGDVFGSWRAMEKACREGKVRAIGVSNFQAGRFFDFAHYVDIKPMVNQLQRPPHRWHCAGSRSGASWPSPRAHMWSVCGRIWTSSTSL